MENNIYVIGLDMEEKNTETIAREAAGKILDLFERLVQEQKDNSKKDE